MIKLVVYPHSIAITLSLLDELNKFTTPAGVQPHSQVPRLNTDLLAASSKKTHGDDENENAESTSVDETFSRSIRKATRTRRMRWNQKIVRALTKLVRPLQRFDKLGNIIASEQKVTTAA